MKQLINIFLMIVMVSPLLRAQSGHSASEILDRVDNARGNPQDQTMTMSLVLVTSKGDSTSRKIQFYQKGDDTRIGKFTWPADQKGIAFLSLPGDITYVYLPAYKKVRRIASHVRNTKFAGTDFTYEDMASGKYKEKWEPKLSGIEDSTYLLELTPKKTTNTDYGRLVLEVDTATFLITKIEYYDRGENPVKIMKSGEYKKMQGYWVTGVMEMHDLKNDHRTIMRLTDIQFDTGLSEDMFSERFLRQ